MIVAFIVDLSMYVFRYLRNFWCTNGPRFRIETNCRGIAICMEKFAGPNPEARRIVKHVARSPHVACVLIALVFHSVQVVLYSLNTNELPGARDS